MTPSEINYCATAVAAPLTHSEIGHYAVGVAGNVLAFVLFVSPIPTFRRIIRNKSVEQFSVLPYIFALLNCLICMWYGLPFVSYDNILLTTVNGMGAAFQFTYILLYITYSPKETWIKVAVLLLSVIGIFSIIALISLLFMEWPHRTAFVGYLSVVTLLGMFASPLSIMKLVIETKSVEYMPFYLSLSTFLMSTSFFAYGIFGHDAYVAVPNGIGSLLGIIQVGLYLYYRTTGFTETNSERQSLLLA